MPILAHAKSISPSAALFKGPLGREQLSARAVEALEGADVAVAID